MFDGIPSQKEASEHRVFRVALIVNLSHVLAEIFMKWLSKGNQSAGIRRLRKSGGDGDHGFVEECGINPVIDERSLQRNLPAGIACSRSDRREITGENRCGRNKLARIRCILPDRRALVAAEEEELVMNNRSAQRPAELVALERIVCRSEIILGIE